MARKQQTAQRLYYKIGEACKLLDIQPYVLRYWETEFPVLAPTKSKSGQRVYSEKELGLIRRIKELLYEEGYTIAGAKKKLEGELEAGDPVSAANAGPAEVQGAPADQTSLDTAMAEKLKTLHEGITTALRDAREILSLLSSS